MDHKLRVMLAGGGTGGHIFPGLALAEELLRRQPGAEVLLVGTERQAESRIVGSSGLRHIALPVEPLSRLKRRPLQFAWRNLRAWRNAAGLLRETEPDAVVGLGGYAAVPVLLAARSAGIPSVLLEQNAIPGRTNRWMSSRADLVCLSFEESRGRLGRRARCCVTGNPVRRQIAQLASRPEQRLGVERPTLLVVGGSQGARAVNDAMLAAAGELREVLRDWWIVHQTGSGDEERCRAAYGALGLECVVSAFFDEVGEWLARATLAVSRAGATTLAELACAGIPAVLVPYPHAADDHQRANAMVYASAGAARLVEQQDDAARTAEALRSELSGLLERDEKLRAMRQGMRALARPDAAANVAEEVLLLIERNAR